MLQAVSKLNSGSLTGARQNPSTDTGCGEGKCKCILQVLDKEKGQLMHKDPESTMASSRRLLKATFGARGAAPGPSDWLVVR